MLQTIFYPFELYSRTCGTTALDVFWKGETFSGGTHTGVRVLDVSATLDDASNRLSVYVVNRSQTESMETTIKLDSACFGGGVQAYVVNGPDIKAENTFDNPNKVGTTPTQLTADQQTSFTYTFEPHSVTALVFDLK